MDDQRHQAAVHVGPWRRRARRVEYANPWITVWHDEVDRPDGSPGIYGVVHVANVAVGVIVLDGDDRVVLVGQHRYTLDGYSWEIPEGGVPPGESAVDGARRELREETGVEADDWRELFRFHLSNSISDEVGVVFSARAVSQGEAAPEPAEELAIRWLPFDDVLAMTRDGRITDAITIMAVQRVALDRLKERSARTVDRRPSVKAAGVRRGQDHRASGGSGGSGGLGAGGTMDGRDMTGSSGRARSTWEVGNGPDQRT